MTRNISKVKVIPADVIRKNIFVGIAEFDEDEGPIISLIYPPNYPLDINYLYAIADYALHLESKSLFELNPYNVLSIPFKIYSPQLPRKYKYYALIISWKEKIREAIHQNIAPIEQLAQTTLNTIKHALTDTARLKLALRQLYNLLIENIVQGGSAMNDNQHSETKNAIIIDRILGLAYGDISILRRYISGEKPKVYSVLSERFILIAY